MPEPPTTRILVIDDDAAFAETLRLHLESAGYAVDVAEDAVEGGRALLAHPPSLILCDIGMPYMDGLELMSLMQTDATSASIPVVFISGRSDSRTLATAVDLGAADFLVKPITREQLLSTIESCLQEGGRRAVPPDFSFPPVA
jgi:DNA-binding response OmpR family regulator